MINLFIITSVINITNLPLSYCQTRSIYDHNTRFQQTLNTIATIKANDPTALIALVEGSQLSDSQKQQLITQTTYFIDLSVYPCVKNDVDSQYKALGECSLLINGLCWLKQMCPQLRYDNLFKISGRYFLNEQFNIQEFANTYNMFSVCGDRYATTLYKIHYSHIDTFIDVLHKVIYNHVDKGMELGLFIEYPPQHQHNLVINTIGVSGLIAVWDNCLISN